MLFDCTFVVVVDLQSVGGADDSEDDVTLLKSKFKANLESEAAQQKAYQYSARFVLVQLCLATARALIYCATVRTTRRPFFEAERVSGSPCPMSVKYI